MPEREVNLEELPFYGFWREFKEDPRNIGKRKHVLFGLGTSGERNAKEIKLFLEQNKLSGGEFQGGELISKEDDRYFIILIDDLYSYPEHRHSSMRPFLREDQDGGALIRARPPQSQPQRQRQNRRRENRRQEEQALGAGAGQEEIRRDAERGVNLIFNTDLMVENSEKYIKAKNDQGHYLYLWGTTIPTKRAESMGKYMQVRNDPKGPYEHGKECTLEDIDEQDNVYTFYSRLQAFVQDRDIKSILVYNQGFYNSNVPYRTIEETFRGPRFRTTRRVEAIREGNDARWSTVNTGLYFENFCEFLYVLWKSEKPIYILEQTGQTDQSDDRVKLLTEERIFERNQLGGKKKQTRKRKSKRSQSRRKRTV